MHLVKSSVGSPKTKVHVFTAWLLLYAPVACFAWDKKKKGERGGMLMLCMYNMPSKRWHRMTCGVKPRELKSDAEPRQNPYGLVMAVLGEKEKERDV